MGRSTKKGPFVAPELLKRVIALNESGDKKVLKTWSVISSASLPPPVPTRVMRATRISNRRKMRWKQEHI